MDYSTKRSTSNKSKLVRTFAKVLHIRSTTLSDKFQKTKTSENINSNEKIKEEKLREKATMAAFISKLFATISSIKSAYAQLQYAQFPYDAEGIQSADQIVVADLKTLSELKQSFLKKHLDDSTPEMTLLFSEIEEQKNLVKTYEITCKKLDNQTKLKDSEIIFLKEKLEENRRENKSIEKRLNSSGTLSNLWNFDFLSLKPTNFVSVFKQTTKSIRNLVKFMIIGMESANWNLDSAATAIHPDVVYWDPTHICYAFESFVCREMYDGFNFPEFSKHGNHQCRRFFFDKFTELKSLKAREYVTSEPESKLAGFCRWKYLNLVHPKMEMSLFGNLSQRDLVNAGEFPETDFFDLFLECAKRVWVLHCLAFSFEHVASVFQVAKGCRFSEVFMDSVNEEAFLSAGSSPEVGFTVVPGFKLGKTVIQCEVYTI
ncbi:hypothetical protein Lser_V15G45437 [Lactuca serriola]